MIEINIQIKQTGTVGRPPSTVNLTVEEFLKLRNQMNSISAQNIKTEPKSIVIPCDKNGNISAENFNKIVEMITQQYKDEFNYFNKL